MRLFKRKPHDVVVTRPGEIVIIDGIPYLVEPGQIRQLMVVPFYHSVQEASKGDDGLGKK